MRLVSFAYAIVAILLLAIAGTCAAAGYLSGAVLGIAAGLTSFCIAIGTAR